MAAELNPAAPSPTRHTTRSEAIADPLQIVTVAHTEIRQLTEGGWRMVVHHANPAPEAPPRAEEERSSTAHTLH